MPLNLDYFYGREAEQYSFYRIPKALFTDAHYKAVTVEAKVLYGLLLVKNVKAYTLTALYNAPTTIGQYYASLVSHDMAQGFE